MCISQHCPNYQHTTNTSTARTGVYLDPEYDVVKPLPVAAAGKKGIQCGECGMKFDNNTAYGFHCGNYRCPVQLKPSF